MFLKRLRLLTAMISVISIVSMILSAIFDHLGILVGFGVFSAIAIIAMITSTAAVSSQARPNLVNSDQAIETLSTQLERTIVNAVEGGAREPQIREVVRVAVQIGRKTTDS